MSGGAVGLASAAEGSARVADYHTLPFAVATALSASNVYRGGIQVGNIYGSGSNWGLGGTDTGTLIRNAALGAGVYQIRGGANAHIMRIPLVVIKPTNVTRWRNGLWVVEVTLAWPTNAVGADNGLVMGFNNIGNLRRSISQGWYFENDTAGVIRAAVRGPTGTVFTNTTVAPTDLTKVRVEFRQAIKSRPATVRFFVNDAFLVESNSDDGNFPAIGAGTDSVVTTGLGCGSATDYVHVYDWNVWNGPDTVVGG